MYYANEMRGTKPKHSIESMRKGGTKVERSGEVQSLQTSTKDDEELLTENGSKVGKLLDAPGQKLSGQ